MHAVIFGKLDCLKHLIAKGANLQATDNVSAARQPPPANPQPLTPAPHARGEYDETDQSDFLSDAYFTCTRV